MTTRNQRTQAVVTVALALAVAACSSGDTRSTVSSGRHETTSVALSPAKIGGLDGPRTIDLRLRGVGATAPLHLQVASVVAELEGGGRLPVTLVPGDVDLSVADQAWRVATVLVPPDAAAVIFTVRFAPGGSLGEKAGNVAVDLRGAPVRFRSPAPLLWERDKAVLRVDVTRSLVQYGKGRLFLPHFTVAY